MGNFHCPMTIRELQDNVLELLGRPRTDVLLDWTSIVYYGDMAKLAKYGYSRDHNPGERQLTLGAAQLAPPYDVPIGLTVEAGNMNDQMHMKATYGQVKRLLAPGSLVVFDRGANDKSNLDRIELDDNDYLTAKKLNVSDDAVFQAFSKDTWECIDAENVNGNPKLTRFGIPILTSLIFLIIPFLNVWRGHSSPPS